MRKLYKNLKTGVHHYVVNDATLCRGSKNLKPKQWVESEQPNPVLMCFRCQELAAHNDRKFKKKL